MHEILLYNIFKTFFSSPHPLRLAGLTDLTLPTPHILRASPALLMGQDKGLGQLLASPQLLAKTLHVLLTLSFSSSANLPRCPEALALGEQMTDLRASVLSILKKQQN